MSTLFTTVFGSKLYGTDTPESDTDLKSVYLPELKKLLRGHRVKNSVYTTGDKAGKNTAEDLDHEHIPLQVLAEDFVKGQTYALEMVFVALHPYDVYHEFSDHEVEALFQSFASELADQFLTSNISAMLGYALGQASKYGIKGTRLNLMRQFHDLVMKYSVGREEDKLETSQEFLDEVDAMSNKYLYLTTYEGPKTHKGEQSIDPAISLLEKIMPLNISFENARNRTSAMLKKFGDRADKAAASGGHDWKAISHALRITMQAYDILTKKTLRFPFDDERKKYLLEVKQGKHSWENVSGVLRMWLDMVDGAKEVTELPTQDDAFTTRFYEWLDAWMLDWYGIND